VRTDIAVVLALVEVRTEVVPFQVRDSDDDRRALTRLVVEPAASLLGGKRLVLVLPGALSLVPFGALPQPGAGPNLSPLIAAHEIVQVPSATILGAMRQLTSGRARPTRTAAIFADPIFDVQDPRVRVKPASVRVRRDAVLNRERPAGASLTRLPFSRGEAEAIRSLAPGRVTMFLGPEATRERVLSRALFDYHFIHFATHGIVNQDVSSLSSLVLSLVDPAGASQDGFVMIPDIYDMTLNADVVVLSGCQTALGKQVRGEGPIGLARAFMYAGVPRVVASLWQVDDLATAELMKRFYRGMLVDELTPAAALRAAQRDLATGRRWASPYFWAPFVLQGDWR
jgi:CHAT domain-containing protein